MSRSKPDPYPDYLKERDYYDDLLGKGLGDPDFHGYPGQPKWEYGDNDKRDPEQNWDEEELVLEGGSYE